MALTKRQVDVLECIWMFINKKGYSPAFREIAEGVGITSLSTVSKHLDTLESKGYIKRRDNGRRAIYLTVGKCPVWRPTGKGHAEAVVPREEPGTTRAIFSPASKGARLS